MEQTDMAADEGAVRALYQQMMEAWSRGSAEDFAAPFTDEGDFVAFDGAHFKGRREIVSFHRPLFEKWLKGTRLVGQVNHVQFLSPDIALMHATGGTVMRGQSSPSPERDSIQTLVAKKQSGTWRLSAFHNTRVRPIGHNVAGTLAWMVSDWLWKVCRPKT